MYDNTFFATIAEGDSFCFLHKSKDQEAYNTIQIQVLPTTIVDFETVLLVASNATFCSVLGRAILAQISYTFVC